MSVDTLYLLIKQSTVISTVLSISLIPPSFGSVGNKRLEWYSWIKRSENIHDKPFLLLFLQKDLTDKFYMCKQSLKEVQDSLSNLWTCKIYYLYQNQVNNFHRVIYSVYLVAFYSDGTDFSSPLNYYYLMILPFKFYLNL